MIRKHDNDEEKREKGFTNRFLIVIFFSFIGFNWFDTFNFACFYEYTIQTKNGVVEAISFDKKTKFIRIIFEIFFYLENIFLIIVFCHYFYNQNVSLTKIYIYSVVIKNFISFIIRIVTWI